MARSLRKTRRKKGKGPEKTSTFANHQQSGFAKAWPAYISELVPKKSLLDVPFNSREKKVLFRDIKRLLKLRCSVQKAVYDTLKEFFEKNEITEVIDVAPGASIPSIGLVLDGVLQSVQRIVYMIDPEEMKNKKVEENIDMHVGDRIGRSLVDQLGLDDKFESRGKIIDKDYHAFQFPQFQHAILAEHGLSLPRNIQVSEKKMIASNLQPPRHRDPELYKSVHMDSYGLTLTDILADMDDVSFDDPRYLHLFDTPYKPVGLKPIQRYIRACIDEYPHWEIESSELIGERKITHYTVLKQKPCKLEDKDWVNPETGDVRPAIEVIDEIIANEDVEIKEA